MISPQAFRRTMIAVLLLTLVIGGGEALGGRLAESAYIVKDGLEWGYGAAIYAIGLTTFGRSARWERWGGFLSAAVLAVGGCQGLAEFVAALLYREIDDTAGNLALSSAISLIGSALVVALLRRCRHSDDPVVDAAWLFGRNDFINSVFDAAFSAVTLAAGLRWLDQVSTLVGVGLSFRAAWVVAREAWATRS